jgi:hypothetical protein
MVQEQIFTLMDVNEYKLPPMKKLLLVGLGFLLLIVGCENPTTN